MDSDLSRTTHSRQDELVTSHSRRQCPLCSLELVTSAVTCPSCDVPVGEQFEPGGRIADKYEIIETIGSGGMGIIYKARQLLLDKVVALKMMHSHLAAGAALMRFQQEGKAASSLSHPNVINVHDFGVTPLGQPYMVMDFVDGETLSEKLKREGPLFKEEFIRIFSQVLGAIQHAHAKGILHRDLKPSNIMLRKDAEPEHCIKLVDFGIAKMIEASDREKIQLTRTGEALGSPLYMSPEQALGRSVDRRSDLYSLGCVMYESLTGSPPFMGDTVVDTMLKHMNDTPVPLKDAFMGTDFQKEANDLVMKLLAKEPDDRYQIASDVLADLKRLAAGSLAAGGSETVSSLRDKAGSAKKEKDTVTERVIIGAVIVAVVVLLTIAYYTLAPSSNPKIRTAIESSPALDRTLAVPAEKFYKQHIENAFKNGKTDIVLRKGFFGNVFELIDDDLRLFKGPHQVKSLDISEHSITSEALEHIKHLPLERLNLERTRIDSIAPLKDMKSLKELVLAESAITDEGMHAVTSLSGLKKIDLKSTDVSGATLRRLARMKSLSAIDLRGCKKFSQSDTDHLQQSLPHATVMENLGYEERNAEWIAAFQAKDYKKAIAILNEQIKHIEKVDGPNSPRSVPFLHHIAGCYGGLKRLDEAEKYYRKALAVSRKRKGCPTLPDSLDRLAHLLSYTNKRDEARSLIRESLSIHAAKQPVDWRPMSINHRVLGQMASLENKHEEAGRHFRDALRLLSDASIVGDYENVIARTGLAIALMKQNRLSEAEIEFTKAINIADRNDDVKSKNEYLDIHMNCIENYMRLGKWKQAETIARKTLIASEGSRLHQKQVHAHMLEMISALLKEQKQVAEAEVFHKRYEKELAALKKMEADKAAP